MASYCEMSLRMVRSRMAATTKVRSIATTSELMVEKTWIWPPPVSRYASQRWVHGISESVKMTEYENGTPLSWNAP